MTDKPNVLLVEGVNDQAVIEHLLRQHGIDKTLVGAEANQGITQIVDNLDVYLDASGLVHLGIIVDADEDINARWQSLQHRLRQHSYPVPALPDPAGTVIEAESLPRVGIWIMPDNQTRGILEDFLRFLVPAGSNLFGHVRTSIATIPAGEQRFSKLAEPKALIHTWLAWQDEPGKAMGTAITARYLDANVAEVDVLVSWLNRLFLP